MTDYPNAVAISAVTGAGLETLLDDVDEVLRQRMIPVDLLIPYRAGELVALAHTHGFVEHEEHTGEGTHLRGRLPVELAGRYSDYWADQNNPFHLEE